MYVCIYLYSLPRVRRVGRAGGADVARGLGLFRVGEGGLGGGRGTVYPQGVMWVSYKRGWVWLSTNR